MPDPARVLVRLSAALWCGTLRCIGALVAPALFSLLHAVDAARVVSFPFRVLAFAGLGGAVFILILNRLPHGQALSGAGRRTVSLRAVGTGPEYFGCRPLLHAWPRA